MPLPIPRPGLVIGYAYLWQAEQRQGQREGIKDRPCVIVLAVESKDDEIIVTVAPITHSPPRDEAAAIEIPAATKRQPDLWLLNLESEFLFRCSSNPYEAVGAPVIARS